LKLRAGVRTLITALGAAAFGQIVSRWVPSPFSAGARVAQAQPASLWAALFPFLVGGLIAGVAMGFVASDDDLGFGIVAFLLFVAFMVYPGVVFGVLSSKGWFLFAAGSCCSLAGLWIGRRLRGDENAAA
jgi:hypothetical protein